MSVGGTCSSCIFWDQQAVTGDPTKGRCRRAAPQPAEHEAYYPATFWVITDQYDWCGEYQAVQPAQQLPVVSGVAPTQPDLTVTAEVMLGLGAVAGFSITPIRTGRIAAVISGTLTSSVNNAQIVISGRHGTGTAPANGDPVTGILWATAQHYLTSTAKDVNGFTVVGGNASLALGVPVWFDVSVASPTGGNTTIDDVQSILWEL